MREIGIFDKYFYYITSEKGITPNIKVNLKFKEPVNHKILLSAANEALSLFPEFSVRPVLKDNTIFYEENFNPVALLPSSSNYNFGSSDMNDYLFCFQADPSKECEIDFSIHHGLSDWCGFYKFLRAIICRYAVKVKGLPDDYFNDVTRSKVPDRSEWDTEINLRPYEVFAKQDAVTPYKPEIFGEVFYPTEKAFSLDSTANRYIRITLSKSQFSNVVKKYNTSSTPYILYIVSNALRDTFNTDKNILIVLPADMRRVFNVDCMTNFTNPLLLPSSLTEHNAPVEEQCRRFRKMIDLQKQPDNLSRLLYYKVQSRKKLFSSPGSIISKIREIISKIPEQSKLLSMAMSYPGSLDMPEGANDLFEDIVAEPMVSNPVIDIQTYRDKLRINLDNHYNADKYNSDKIVKAICNRLSSDGIETTITDSGPIEHNVMNLEKFKKV